MKVSKFVQIDSALKDARRVFSELSGVVNYHLWAINSPLLSESNTGKGASRRCEFRDNTSIVETIAEWREHAGRGMLLCGLLLASNLAYAQWDYSSIEILTDEANGLKEQGFFANAYELYPTIMHQMRIHNGLYNEDQLPLLMEMAAWHVRKSEHEEAKNLLDRTEFYMGRNPNPLDNYRILVVQRLYLPDEQRCHKRGKNGFLNPSNYCDKQRYYRADSFIAATQLMVKIVAISDNRKSDLIALAGLAEITAYSVYDVYGSSYSSNTHTNMIPKTLNIRVGKNYQHQKWSGIKRHALAQLQIEFDYGG